MKYQNLVPDLEKIKQLTATPENVASLSHKTEEVLANAYSIGFPDTVDETAFLREVFYLLSSHAALRGDAPEMIRYAQQVISLEQNDPELPEDSRSNTVKALYLLALLTQTKYSQFNLEAESLTSKERSSPEISFSMKVYDILDSNAYEQLPDARQSLPSVYFTTFFDQTCKSVPTDHHTPTPLPSTQSKEDDIIAVPVRRIIVSTLSQATAYEETV
ncbi:hypothetical protein BLNAU_4594 [Blattamonas nauphoetae]|uniref:Uncharacterized protein n=1 Tax=Blattamonas nauphoetae TaxID=2049346 RepID=A0ABQ9Y9D5_9EUKA|nr:hypothetical protein BLNAU_4594 [Blattamonas nauphoetae]